MGAGARAVRAVVIFASEDQDLASTLVDALRGPCISVWWSEDINCGDWEREVLSAIENGNAVVPLVTRNTKEKPIFKDEWRHAVEIGRATFPFVLDASGVPLGLGSLNRTMATEWEGQPTHPAVARLREKLMRHFGVSERGPIRVESLTIGRKSLALPTFVFSLSSFETQLDPINGLELMQSVATSACLISAYDVASNPRRFNQLATEIAESNTVLVLDSGNYEAARKDDYVSKSNQLGWSKRRYWEAVTAVPADIVFAYDRPDCRGAVDRIVDDTLDRYIEDWRETGIGADTLCPIVHVPSDSSCVEEDASALVAAVAREVRPPLIAIPERELGEGLLTRMNAVKRIRSELARLEWYQPLHILGTGNPMTVGALSVCGADSFDGLEWCRTAANYETHNLLHFQQFDVLKLAFGGRVSNSAARSLIELDAAPFPLKVASYNLDYFEYWMGHVQHWVHSPRPEGLFENMPYVGPSLVERYRA